MIAPAKTGKEVIRRTEVTANAQIIKGRRSKERAAVRDPIIVVRKLIEPIIEEIPAK